MMDCTMFDVFIIERIRQEEERRREDNRPRLEVPLPDVMPEEPSPSDGCERGVLIIEPDDET